MKLKQLKSINLLIHFIQVRYLIEFIHIVMYYNLSNCIKIPPAPLYERGSRSKVIRFLYDAFKIDLTERDKQLNNISTYFYFISVYFR